MLDIQDAISFLEQREPREAIRLLEPMVAEMPAYATARVLLARSYEALNEWDRALKVWREALQLIPNSPVIRRGLERAAARGAGRRGRAPISGEETAFAPPSTPTSPESKEPPTYSEAEPADEPTYAPEPPVEPEDWGEPDAEPDEPFDEATYEEPQPPARTTDEGRSAPQLTERSGVNDESTTDERRTTNDITRREDIPLPTHFPPARREPPGYERPPQQHPGHEEDEFDELQEVGDTGTPHYEDLDRLINELESARIVPRPDLDELPSPDLEDDIEDVVSETLARIYASQGQYDEAARVYELLAGQHPEEADEYMQKASQMRSRASDGD